MRLPLFLVSALLSGCFEETTDGDGGDTDASVVPSCRECQMQECAEHEAACAAEGECNECVAAPFGLLCLSNENMHRLGSCACERCGNQCDYLCPGPAGACNSCGIAECPDEGNACLADNECAPCFEDPNRPGCAENPLFMMARACQCMNCGQACIWECPSAGNTCATCISTDCADPFSQCMQDDGCTDCFASPYLSTCPDNMAYQSLLVCICGACSPDCGVLFECG